MDIDEQPVSNSIESPSTNTEIENTTNNGVTIEEDNKRSSITPPPAQPQPQPQPIVASNSATPVSTPAKKSKLESTTSTNKPPIHEIVGGSSVRRYLNEHVTLALLEGLKELAQVKPEDPLKYLGEYLIAKSEEERS